MNWAGIHQLAFEEPESFNAAVSQNYVPMFSNMSYEQLYILHVFRFKQNYCVRVCMYIYICIYMCVCVR